MDKIFTPLVRNALLVAFLALGICGAIVLKQELDLQKAMMKKKHFQLFYLPSDKNLARISIGYKAFLADLIWIRGLLYVGAHFYDGGSIKWVTDYARAITNLDPKFKRPYAWGATIAVYNRRYPTRAEELEGIKLLKTGTKRFPEDFQMWHQLALAYLHDIRIGTSSLKQLEKDYIYFCNVKTIPKKLLGKHTPMVKGVRKCLNRIIFTKWSSRAKCCCR